MAITRAQQAKQMLQNGGMLVQPGFGGTRQGYKGGQDLGAGASGMGSGNTGGNTGGDGDNRSDRMGITGKTDVGTKGLSDKARGDLEAMTRGLRSSISAQNRAAAVKDFIDKAKKFSLINLGKKGLDFLSTLGGPKTKDNLDIEGYNMANIAGPAQKDFGPEDGEGGSRLFAPLVSSAPVTSGPVTSAPAASSSTGQNLNRIAYRLMADGGAVIDDEPRQAYGLGSIVRKATRAVKKVAKSPIGKAALLYAGTAGLGALGAGSAGTGFGFKMFAPSAVASNFGATAARIGASRFFADPMTRAFGKGNLMGDPAQFFTSKGSSSLLGNIFGGKTGLATAGILAASTLPLLGVGVEEQEEEELSPYVTEGLDMAAIRANPRKFQGQAYRLMSEGGSTDLSDDPNYKGWVKVYEKSPEAAEMNEKHSEYLNFYERNKTKQAEGSKEPVAKKVMPLLDMDGMEKDYRETGGFVEMGRMEKADDVPARLSKNEFVFTADAVRNAGDGSVDKGAEVMYNMMKNLEAGGEVSEESQGLKGARRMFQTSQRLEEVL